MIGSGAMAATASPSPCRRQYTSPRQTDGRRRPRAVQCATSRCTRSMPLDKPRVRSSRNDPAMAALVDHWSAAAQAYLNGDLPTYARLAHHAADYVLTPPNGGDPRPGFDASDDAAEWTA